MSAKQGQKQGQKQGPEYLGKGLYTAAILSSPAAIMKKMEKRGANPDLIKMLFQASYPKGHPEHLSVNAAAKQYCPNIQPMSALGKVFGIVRNFFADLLVGQELEQYSTAYENRKPKPTGTRPRIPVEKKAERDAVKQLNMEYREKNGLGTRGRLNDEQTEKCKAYVEKHFASRTKTVIKEYQTEEEGVPA